MTGGNGYIGSNLLRRLIRQKHEVSLITRSSSNLTLIKDLKPYFSLHQHNGSSLSLVKIMEKSKPEVVIHLAAYSAYENSYQNIEELILSNILFGTQILEAMASNSVPFIINTGSYWQHLNYSPNSLYAATKESFQNILKFYSKKFSIKSITLKLFDTYGPNDQRNKIFPYISNAAKNNKSIKMSEGEQLIDTVYISDVIEAYMVSMNRLAKLSSSKKNEVFFISSGKHIKLRTLVEKYLNVTQQKINIHWGGKPYKKMEIMVPINNTPQLPNWKIKISLDTGLNLIKESFSR